MQLLPSPGLGSSVVGQQVTLQVLPIASPWHSPTAESWQPAHRCWECSALWPPVSSLQSQPPAAPFVDYCPGAMLLKRRDDQRNSRIVGSRSFLTREGSSWHDSDHKLKLVTVAVFATYLVPQDQPTDQVDNERKQKCGCSQISVFNKRLHH